LIEDRTTDDDEHSTDVRIAAGSPASQVTGPPDGLAQFRLALFARTPRLWVTPLLVGMNLAVFLGMVATGVSALNPSAEGLLRWGANYAPRTTAGEWWRLVTNVFVHIGVIHIAMNMLVLWQIGALVERLLGHRPFLLVYLVAGFCGSLASISWHPLVISAGASSAVFGIYGVLIAYLVLHRGSIPRTVLLQLQKSTAFFIGLNVLFGLQQKGIDMAAHVGGAGGRIRGGPAPGTAPRGGDRVGGRPGASSGCWRPVRSCSKRPCACFRVRWTSRRS
jgi:rhomboid protease GluP